MNVEELLHIMFENDLATDQKQTNIKEELLHAFF